MTDEAFDSMVAAMARARTRRTMALALAGALAAGCALRGALSGGGGVAAAPRQAIGVQAKRAVLLRPLPETEGQEHGQMPMQPLPGAVSHKPRLLSAERHASGLRQRDVPDVRQIRNRIRTNTAVAPDLAA